MDRNALAKILYAKKFDPDEQALVNFNALTGRPIASMISEQDIFRLYQIATDSKLNAKLKEKIKLMTNILKPLGFERFCNGTNRIAYRCVYDNRILIKVALDRVGLGDSIKEMQNQIKLAPFVTKVFDVHPSGVIACVERVQPIKSHKVLALLSEDFYNLITKIFIGKYVMEDIGDEYFMNWGIREGFGLVLLDFPYLYELDGNKLVCRAKDKNNPNIICFGEIDYDIGFNRLVCKKCGMEYRAKDLAKLIDERRIEMVRESEFTPAVIRIYRGDVLVHETQPETNCIEEFKPTLKNESRKAKVAAIPRIQDDESFAPPVLKRDNKNYVVPKVATPAPESSVKEYFVPSTKPLGANVKINTTGEGRPAEIIPTPKPPRGFDDYKRPTREYRQEKRYETEERTKLVVKDEIRPREEVKVVTTKEQPKPTPANPNLIIGNAMNAIAANEVAEIFIDICKKGLTYEDAINDILCLVKARVPIGMNETMALRESFYESFKPVYENIKNTTPVETPTVMDEHIKEEANDVPQEDTIQVANNSDCFIANEIKINFDGEPTAVIPDKEIEPQKQEDNSDTEEAKIQFISIENEGEPDMAQTVEKINPAKEFLKEIDNTIEKYLTYFQTEFPEKSYEQFESDVLQLAKEDFPDYPDKTVKDPIAFGRNYIKQYLQDNKIRDQFIGGEDEVAGMQKFKNKHRYSGSRLGEF